MNINIIAPINPDLGYGIASTYTVSELINLGHNVSLFPIGQPTAHPRHANNIKRALENADTFSVNISCPCVRLWHQFDMSMFVGHGSHIGFPIFELDTFTDKERWHLRSCDRLFVCSEWAKQVIIKNIPEYDSCWISVVPLGVDTTIFTPKLSNRKPTIFLNVGKWEIRKGHDVLVDMFNKAFTESDNVELWMMCNNPFYSNAEQKQWEDRYKNSKLGSKIRMIPRVETSEQVAEIMHQADCGVFPSRAEGWNLEALEMLSCGKYVIATDYSAHTEFLTQDNAMLVPINEVELAYDGKWFFGQGNWAKLDKSVIDRFVLNMKGAHVLKQTGYHELNQKGIETAQKFTWKHTAKTIVKHLS